MARDGDSTWQYFVATLVFTWSAQLPAVFAPDNSAFQPLMGLGIFGPLVAATLLSAQRGGWTTVKDLYRQLITWPASGAWYLFSLALPAALLAVGMAMTSPFIAPRPWFYPPNAPAAWVALFLIPVVEEIGWRGYALPRMQRAHGPCAPVSVLAWSGRSGTFRC